MPKLRNLWPSRKARAQAELQAQAAITPPALPLDLQSAQFIANPYPIYAHLRAHVPVAPLASGGHLLVRHADIVAALSDKRLGNAPSRFSTLAPRNAGKYPAAELASHIPPFLDMPDLKAPRQAISRAFFDALKQADGPIAALAADLVASARSSKRCDLITDIARPFALRAMQDFLGISAEETWLKAKSEAFFALFAPLNDPQKFAVTNAEITEFRTALRAALPQAPAGSFLAQMRGNETQGITQAHMIDAAILIFADGIENIEAGAVACLRAARDAQLTGVDDAAIAEGLRLQTPAQIIPRVVREDFTLHGVPLKAGHPLMLALGSANRDPAALDDPDSFLPTRPEGALTFGRGIHACIGRPLALLLLRHLTAALLQAGAQPQVPSGYHARFGHRWPLDCAITFKT